MNRRPWVMIVLAAVGVIAVACALETRAPRTPGGPVFRSPEQTATAIAALPEVVIIEDTTDATNQEMLISDDGGLTWIEVDCDNYFQPAASGDIFVWNNAIYWVDSRDEGIKRYDGSACTEVQSLTAIGGAYPIYWATTSDNSTLGVMVYDNSTTTDIWTTTDGINWTNSLTLQDDAQCDDELGYPGGMNRVGSTIYAFGLDCYQASGVIKHGLWTSSNLTSWSGATLSGDFIAADNDTFAPTSFAYLGGNYYGYGTDDLYSPSEYLCRIKSTGTWTTDATLWAVEVSTTANQCDTLPLAHPAPDYGSIYGLIRDGLRRSTGSTWTSVLSQRVKDVRAGTKATPGLYAVGWSTPYALYSSSDAGETWANVTPVGYWAAMGVGNFEAETPTATPTPTRTPSPTPTATCAPWITEIYPEPTAGLDYNQRSGVGPNDAFVEIGLCEQRSLAGYQIEVLNAQATPVCRHVYAEDNWSGPLKAIWLDEMTNGLGTDLCSSFPISGTVKLMNDIVARATATGLPTSTVTATGTPPTNTPTATGTPPTATPAPTYTPTVAPRGTPIATADYPGATPGVSYALPNWRTPDTGWAWGTPRPGR